MKKLIISCVFVSIIIYLCSIYYLSEIPPHTVEEYANTSTSFDTFQLFFPQVSKELHGYFVSTKGDDSNPGTLNLPWKTIGKAARSLVAGDTVYIREGVYNETIQFTTSGTLLNPIQIFAFPGENPIIDGFNNIPGPGSALLWIIGDYIYASGLEVRNSKYFGILVLGNYNVVSDMFIHHNQSTGILITGGYSSTVEDSRIWRNALSNEYGGGNAWGTGISAARSGVSFATIRNNSVWENWGEGISTFEADHITIEDNISHDNFSTNIYLSDSTNVSCQRNFVFTDPDSYVFPYGSHAGIMLGDETYDPPSANITVINNIAYGNQGNFWWWQGVEGGGMNNVLIANNTFVNGIGDPNRGRGGVIISRGDHQNVRFENNLVRQDGELPVIATIDQPGIAYSHNLWSKPPYDYVISLGDIIADPKLSEMSEPFSVEWFIPFSSSPAIDQALGIPHVVDDYFLHPRGAFPDMGAIEYIPD
jgi:hypothetical protein